MLDGLGSSAREPGSSVCVVCGAPVIKRGVKLGRDGERVVPALDDQAPRIFAGCLQRAERILQRFARLRPLPRVEVAAELGV